MGGGLAPGGLVPLTRGGGGPPTAFFPVLLFLLLFRLLFFFLTGASSFERGGRTGIGTLTTFDNSVSERGA